MTYYYNTFGKITDDMIRLFKKFIGKECKFFINESLSFGSIIAFELALVFQEGVLRIQSDYECSEVKDRLKYEFSHFIISESTFLSEKLRAEGLATPVNATLLDVLICREPTYCFENSDLLKKIRKVMDCSFEEIMQHREDIIEFSEFDSGLCFIFNNMSLKLELIVFVTGYFCINISKEMLIAPQVSQRPVQW